MVINNNVELSHLYLMLKLIKLIVLYFHQITKYILQIITLHQQNEILHIAINIC